MKKIHLIISAVLFVAACNLATSASVDSKEEPDGIRNYTLNFPETDSKYIRIVATAVESIPEWHNGKNHRGFLFVDEVTVN